ncbi:hypothetical protein [Oleidesulfovibrio sp.]|uniref:hypothetical protein n=1 Tax=Oleidesulfovibrio sp. TaxID=2909707 RepID=UPI003A87D2EA
MALFIPKHFGIEELMPPEMVKAEASPVILFARFDPAALWTLDELRKHYGPCTVNNWQWGGNFTLSGYRPEGCGIGAKHSCHKDGRAFDCKFCNVTPAEIWADMQRNPQAERFLYIRRIEAFDGMSWFHFDTGNHDKWREGIKVICPRGKRGVLPVFISRASVGKAA